MLKVDLISTQFLVRSQLPILVKSKQQQLLSIILRKNNQRQQWRLLEEETSKFSRSTTGGATTICPKESAGNWKKSPKWTLLGSNRTFTPLGLVSKPRPTWCTRKISAKMRMLTRMNLICQKFRKNPNLLSGKKTTQRCSSQFNNKHRVSKSYNPPKCKFRNILSQKNAYSALLREFSSKAIKM